MTIDVKIGFHENPREFVIKTEESIDELKSRIIGADQGVQSFVELKDSKGKVYLLAARSIAYVEFGTEETRRVGFATTT